MSSNSPTWSYASGWRTAGREGRRRCNDAGVIDSANPDGYIGGWVLYATRCGHPIYYGNTEFDCRLIWHEFDHGPMTGPSVGTATHSDVRLATQADLDAIRRGDSCEQYSLETTTR